MNTQGEHKEGDPIPFMITKKDMEYFMNVLHDAYTHSENKSLDLHLLRMKKAFQHMIDEEIRKGKWK